MSIKAGFLLIRKYPEILLTPVCSFWTFGPIQSPYNRKMCNVVLNSNKIGISYFYTWLNIGITIIFSVIGCELFFYLYHWHYHYHSHSYHGWQGYFWIIPSLLSGIFMVFIVEISDSHNGKIETCASVIKVERTYLYTNDLNKVHMVERYPVEENETNSIITTFYKHSTFSLFPSDGYLSMACFLHSIFTVVMVKVLALLTHIFDPMQSVYMIYLNIWYWFLGNIAAQFVLVSINFTYHFITFCSIISNGKMSIYHF